MNKASSGDAPAVMVVDGSNMGNGNLGGGDDDEEGEGEEVRRP